MWEQSDEDWFILNLMCIKFCGAGKRRRISKTGWMAEGVNFHCPCFKQDMLFSSMALFSSCIK